MTIFSTYALLYINPLSFHDYYSKAANHILFLLTISLTHALLYINYLTFHDNYSKVVLDITNGVEDMGTIKWQLVLCLLGAWILVCFCLAKGIKSGGKVSPESR